MKYTSKVQVIKHAQALGSTSKTYAGAARYILQNTPSIFKTAYHPSKWERTRRDYLNLIYDRRASHICKFLGLWTRDNLNTELALHEAKVLNPALKSLTKDWPFRKSESHWAGGNHSIHIYISAEPGAAGDSSRAWSHNNKWTGTNSSAYLHCTVRALCFFPTLRSKDGSIILDAEKLAHREYAVTWVEQGRGFDLKLVKGFLIRGHHVKAVSWQRAQKKVKAARKTGAENLLKTRVNIKINKQNTAFLKNIWVGVDDSLKSGNCRSQTEVYLNQLCVKAGAEIGGIRADHLLSLRDDMYTRRAVQVAASRYI